MWTIDPGLVVYPTGFVSFCCEPVRYRGIDDNFMEFLASFQHAIVELCQREHWSSIVLISVLSHLYLLIMQALLPYISDNLDTISFPSVRTNQVKFHSYILFMITFGHLREFRSTIYAATAHSTGLQRHYVFDWSIHLWVCAWVHTVIPP